MKGYTLQEKLNLIKEHEKSLLSHPQFAKSKGIALSTWRDIFKSKEKLVNDLETGSKSSKSTRKRKKYSQKNNLVKELNCCVRALERNCWSEQQKNKKQSSIMSFFNL